MAKKLLLNPNLKSLPHEDGLRKTYLGQAHIAGTGPAGKTCRECIFWGRHHADNTQSVPGYSRDDRKEKWRINDAACNTLRHRKANRAIPPDAEACRLFEQAENPPPLYRPEKEK